MAFATPLNAIEICNTWRGYDSRTEPKDEIQTSHSPPRVHSRVLGGFHRYSHPANRRLTQTRRGRRLRVLALLGRGSNTVVYFEPAKHHSKKLEQGKTKPRKLLQLIEPFNKMRHWNPSDRVSLQMSADANKGE